mgnify:CR=1 FL=1
MKNLKIGIGVLLIANILPVISIFVHDFIGSEYSTVQSYVIGFFFNIGLTIFIALYNLISWLFEDL